MFLAHVVLYETTRPLLGFFINLFNPSLRDITAAQSLQLGFSLMPNNPDNDNGQTFRNCIKRTSKYLKTQDLTEIYSEKFDYALAS